MFWCLVQQSIILPNKLLPDTLRTWHLHDHFLTPTHKTVINHCPLLPYPSSSGYSPWCFMSSKMFQNKTIIHSCTMLSHQCKSDSVLKTIICWLSHLFHHKCHFMASQWGIHFFSTAFQIIFIVTHLQGMSLRWLRWGSRNMQHSIISSDG